MKTGEKGEREELEEGLVLLEDESVFLRVRGRSPEEEDQEEANLSLVSRARQRSTSCSRARPPFCRSLFEKEKGGVSKRKTTPPLQVAGFEEPTQQASWTCAKNNARKEASSS